MVEVQRARDEDKRWTWPVYATVLHARLRCPTPAWWCWRATRRWRGGRAAAIATFQPGASFAPLVLGPEQVPRLEPEHAGGARRGWRSCRRWCTAWRRTARPRRWPASVGRGRWAASVLPCSRTSSSPSSTTRGAAP
ncbi:MAG: hypothetical protein HS111_02010 [Kofleriaceae bacterium]|nr:hypothetical protein [Kofleriaceae bacterium]